MKIKKLVVAIYVISIIFSLHTLQAADKKAHQGAKPSGTVSGSISVYRTKVKTKGSKSYKDVVVYLEKVGGNDVPPPKKHAEMNQKGLVFIPHVLPIQKGTTVTFLNNDNELHNVFCPDKCCVGAGKKHMDLGTFGGGKSKDFTFNKVGAATMLCKLHLEMAAYIVVVDTPYFTKAEIDGKTQKATFALKNVPDGKYILKAWHKKLLLKGGARAVTVTAGKTTTADIVITKKKYAKQK